MMGRILAAVAIVAVVGGAWYSWRPVPAPPPGKKQDRLLWPSEYTAPPFGVVPNSQIRVVPTR